MYKIKTTLTFLILILFKMVSIYAMGEQIKEKHVGEHPIKSDVQIYYLPFYIETYIPINRSEMENRAKYMFTLDEKSPKIVSLKSILQTQQKGSFEDGVVRLKIKNLEKWPIYIDQDGFVFANNEEYLIPESSKKKLENFMEQLILEQNIDKPQ